MTLLGIQSSSLPEAALNMGYRGPLAPWRIMTPNAEHPLLTYTSGPPTSSLVGQLTDERQEVSPSEMH